MVTVDDDPSDGTLGDDGLAGDGEISTTTPDDPLETGRLEALDNSITELEPTLDRLTTTPVERGLDTAGTSRGGDIDCTMSSSESESEASTGNVFS